jgi:hypothetical protein
MVQNKEKLQLINRVILLVQFPYFERELRAVLQQTNETNSVASVRDCRMSPKLAPTFCS